MKKTKLFIELSLFYSFGVLSGDPLQEQVFEGKRLVDNERMIARH